MKEVTQHVENNPITNVEVRKNFVSIFIICSNARVGRNLKGDEGRWVGGGGEGA